GCNAFDNSAGGTFDWASGTLRFLHDLGIDSAVPFGATGGDAVTAARRLVVDGTLAVVPGGTLALQVGGQVTCGSFDNSAGGTLDFTGGTLTVDGGAFTPPPGHLYLDGPDTPTLVLRSGGMNLAGSTLWVGDTAAGALEILSGATVAGRYGVIGYQADSNGTVTVDGAGSTWTNADNVPVGTDGKGTLWITNGGRVSDKGGYLGRHAGSVGTATVDGAGSTWQNDLQFFVGEHGRGVLSITGGGSVSCPGASVGLYGDGSGTVTVDGAGSTWTNAGSLYVGGSNTGAGGTGTVSVSDGGLLEIGGRLKLWPGGTVNLDGGTVRFSQPDPIDPCGGMFRLSSGTVEFDCDLTLGSGNETLTHVFGSPVTVASAQGLIVDGTATIQAEGGLVISGGYFRSSAASSAGTLVVADSTVDFGAGGLTTTGEAVLLNATVKGPVTIPTGSAINVVGTVTFQDLVSGGGGIYGSGTAVFAGGHSPGDSIATVPIEGGAAYGPDGTLTIELTACGLAAACDEVVIGGDVTLGGTLELDWLPVPGDANSKFGGVYSILSWGHARTGMFDGVDCRMAAYLDTSVFDDGVEYDDANGEVKIHLHDLLDGDADLDGIVERDDFHAIQAGFGAPDPDWLDGDFNFDGRVDFLDYLTWKANVGDSVPGGEKIPEPATMLLLALGACLGVFRRRRKA
ncbi:MAG: PEP-CTERM sorting domain-containing protein, partial [Phycisphaerae bacterium]